MWAILCFHNSVFTILCHMTCPCLHYKDNISPIDLILLATGTYLLGCTLIAVLFLVHIWLLKKNNQTMIYINDYFLTMVVQVKLFLRGTQLKEYVAHCYL